MLTSHNPTPFSTFGFVTLLQDKSQTKLKDKYHSFINNAALFKSKFTQITKYFSTYTYMYLYIFSCSVVLIIIIILFEVLFFNVLQKKGCQKNK